MLYITVHLFGKQGIRGEFKAYEQKALDLFKKHGGEVVVAYVPTAEKTPGEWPDEIQILRIADRTKFDAFMRDPDRLKMADERDQVIRKTEVFLSDEIVAY